MTFALRSRTCPLVNRLRERSTEALRQCAPSSPLTPDEVVAQQALGHARTVYYHWRQLFGVAAPYAEQPILQMFEEYLLRHPMRKATQMMAALHEAGHYIAFERLGMLATFAHIRGSARGRDGWSSGANAAERPDYVTIAERRDLAVRSGVNR